MSLRRVVPNFQNIFRQFEDNFSNMLSRVPSSMISPTSTIDFGTFGVPAADVHETKNAYVVEVEIPGVPKENVTMEIVDDHNLLLAGHFESKKDLEDPKLSFWSKERMSGEFKRSFTFPSKLVPEGIKANMNDGVLKIEIAKSAEEESKKIPINIE